MAGHGKTWLVAKIVIASAFALAIIGFAYFQAFTGLFLGYCWTIQTHGPYSDGDGYVHGRAAMIFGLVWLILAAMVTVSAVRKIVQGYRES